MIKHFLIINLLISTLHCSDILAQNTSNTIIIGELAERWESGKIKRLFDTYTYNNLFQQNVDNELQIIKHSRNEAIFEYKNPFYFQPHKIIIKFYPSEMALMTAMIIDEIDFAITESAKIAEDIHKSNPAVRVLFQYKPNNYVKSIAYNNQHPIFKRANIRRALSYAINKQKILTSVLNNQASITSGPLDKQSSLFNSEFKAFNYAPKEAIKLLQKEGWYNQNHDGILQKNSQFLSFTIIYEKGNLLDEEIVRMVKVDWNKIGIDVHIKPLTQKTIKKLLKSRSFQAVLTNLHSYETIESLEYYWSSKGKGNYWGYNKPTIDRYLYLAKKAEPNTRHRLLQGVVNTIIQDQPSSFLFFLWLDWYFINNTKFQNFLNEKGGPRPFKEWKIKQ